MLNNYIAILGFALSCSAKNQQLAFDAGQQISAQGFGIAAGSSIGTAKYAFRGAKLTHGSTLAIIEHDLSISDDKHCDIVQKVLDQQLKHQVLAELCIGAIVIGGSNGTLSVVKRFLAENKPVIAIINSGGIVERELNQNKLKCNIILQPDIISAIQQNIQFWSKSAQH